MKISVKNRFREDEITGKKSCEQDSSILMKGFYFKYETGKVIISTGIRYHVSYFLWWYFEVHQITQIVSMKMRSLSYKAS